MPGYVTDEQIRAAKTVDLLSYLKANEPWELKPSGPNEYRTVSHGSLVISNGLWRWNREGFGGRTALDYLIKVRGIGFLDAVETVLGSRAAPTLSPLPAERPKIPVQKKLFLPKAVSFSANAVKYLQRRGVHSDIIGQCLKSGIFYEGIYKNPKEPQYDGTAVCVFIGRDNNGVDRFAALRGINTDLKRDAAGSDKRFGFMLSAKCPDSHALAVFEAPVDLLSHATLAQHGDLEFDGHRLSLGGTSDVALTAYLERNPNIEYISLCMDNDEAGQTTAQKIFADLVNKRFDHIAVTIDPPERGKDYNDALLQIASMKREQKRSGLHREAVSFSL